MHLNPLVIIMSKGKACVAEIKQQRLCCSTEPEADLEKQPAFWERQWLKSPSVIIARDKSHQMWS